MGRANKKAAPTHKQGKATKPGSPKRVKGQCPLQGAGTASLLGFGATPQLFLGRPACQTRPTKGAGSEASLPLTLRVRRRAPKLLYHGVAHCRARWARPRSWFFGHSGSFLEAGDFASAEATRGLSGRPLDPFGSHPCFLIFIGAWGNRACGRDNAESADFPRLVRLELLHRVKCVVHQRHQSQRNRNPEDDSVQRQ